MSSRGRETTVLPGVALQRIVLELQAIRHERVRSAEGDAVRRGGVHPQLPASALHLPHYLALRRRDLRVLQDDLARRGLTLLGRCEAHVLDTLAKTGRPSRAEITDAAASHRSERVMLNNEGPHVVEAVPRTSVVRAPRG